MSEDVVISVKNLSKTFKVRELSQDSIRMRMRNLFAKNNNLRKIEALKNVDLEIKRGEFFGIIGRNGSGKSTLLKIMIGAMRADPGSFIKTKGKIIRLALGMGFDPNLSARENIFVNGTILGLTFKRINLIFDDIIGFAELEDFVDIPVKNYSSGMRARLAFSVAMNAEADIFLMDEFFGGVGDEGFKQKSEEVFRNTIMQGRTIVMVSHIMPTIRKNCERVTLLNKGDQLGMGTAKDMIAEYHKLFPPPKLAQKKKAQNS